MTTVMRARIETPLKQFLSGRGISQAWLAEQIGVTRQELWPWVNGIHVPAEATRRRIASALGQTEDAAAIDALVAELWPDEQPIAEAA
jgi:transcriptional regulator with XRE-family HTH domain